VRGGACGKEKRRFTAGPGSIPETWINGEGSGNSGPAISTDHGVHRQGGEGGKVRSSKKTRSLVLEKIPLVSRWRQRQETGKDDATEGVERSVRGPRIKTEDYTVATNGKRHQTNQTLAGGQQSGGGRPSGEAISVDLLREKNVTRESIGLGGVVMEKKQTMERSGRNRGGRKRQTFRAESVPMK